MLGGPIFGWAGLYAAIGPALSVAVATQTRQVVPTVLATAGMTTIGFAVYWLGFDAVAGATFGA